MIECEICNGTGERDTSESLISEHRLAGTRLLNLADGGNEPKCSNEIRVLNAKKLNASQHSPERKRIWLAKKTLNPAYKKGLLSNYAIGCMREAARLNPSLFGAWKDLKFSSGVAA